MITITITSKKIRIVLALLIIFVVAFCLLFPWYLFFGHDIRVKQKFEKNITEYVEVAEKLGDMDTKYIKISQHAIIHDEMSDEDNVRLNTVKSKIENMINDKKVISIEMSDGAIYFIIERRFTSVVGVAYTKDGKKPKSQQWELIAEKLKDNWYLVNID